MAYEDLLPHFRKIEAHTLLDNEYHGTAGPIRISFPPRVNPLNAATVRAFQEGGLPFNADYNGADQRGVSLSSRTSTMPVDIAVLMPICGRLRDIRTLWWRRRLSSTG